MPPSRLNRALTPFSSTPIGSVISPSSSFKAFTVSAVSVGSTLSARTPMLSETCEYAFCIYGNSIRQGWHQLAQKLISTAFFSASRPYSVTSVPSDSAAAKSSILSPF